MKITSTSLILFLILRGTIANPKGILRLGVFNDLRGLKPAMDVALETVNNDTTLPFVFEVTYSYTMVSQLQWYSSR